MFVYMYIHIFDAAITILMWCNVFTVSVIAVH